MSIKEREGHKGKRRPEDVVDSVHGVGVYYGR